MKLPFRKYHILQILNECMTLDYPLDQFLSNYFRLNRSVGSKDRKYIANSIYEIIRWQGLIDHFCKKPLTLENKVEVFENLDFKNSIYDSTIKEHIRCSFPFEYFSLIRDEYKEKAFEFCLISNTQAPTTIRVNPLKISRDELFENFQKKYSVTKTKFSKYGIKFNEKINFYSLDEFKKGFFEIQDEGSQLISDLIDLKKGDLVLDYCSGSGGKTLAVAHKLQNTGHFFLHDIRKSALIEAKKRLKRAGIENYQIKNSNDTSLKLLKNKISYLILDVPCSGSGTLRRNPDMKWKFNKDNLQNLITLQRKIFHDSFEYVKKDGYIAYFTCSIFSKENEEQLNYFLSNYPIEVYKEPSRLTVQENSHDGFFSVIFKKL
jgi:16S rRNA C967 or C1407 C5-methylase (RsmB/RsmF family)